MIVSRKSELTGEVHEMDLPITQDQILRYNEGIELIQDVFPNLSNSEREFIKSGITAEEWDEIIGEED